jgi:hypothetical protein
MIQASDALQQLNWVVPIVAIVGVVGQWGIGAFYAGRMDERVHGQGREIRDLKIEHAKHDVKLDNHEGRIAHIEGRRGIPLGSQ